MLNDRRAWILFPILSELLGLQNTVERHLSRITGMSRHPDTQKIRIIGFFFENRLYWYFENWLLLFTVHTHASKHFDQA